MLEVDNLKCFYFLRDFHDMRCKYSRVLSVIHQQFNREPREDEAFIVMSRDRRMVRIFTYDSRSFGLYERRFCPGYKFMKVLHDGEEKVFSIQWNDILLLLKSPVVTTLKIR